MKLVVASDERTKLTDFVLDYLKSKGHQLVLRGILADPPSDFPENGMMPIFCVWRWLTLNPSKHKKL